MKTIGTTIALYVSEDVLIMGADLLLRLENATGEFIGHKTSPNPKIDIWGSGQILWGSVGLGRGRASAPITFMGLTDIFTLEYDTHNVLPSVAEYTGVSPGSPTAFLARRIWENTRKACEPCNTLIDAEAWNFNPDGLLGFVVAGFPNESDPPELFNVAVEADTAEKRYLYPPPRKIDLGVLPRRYITGQSDKAYAAINGVEPERSTCLRLFSECIPSIDKLSPNTPDAIRIRIAEIVALIRTESHFNPEYVGRDCTVIVKPRNQSAFTLTVLD